MPGQDRIRRHDGCDLAQDLPAERLPFGRKSATLIIGEAEASTAGLELLLEDPILFDQALDHRVLAAPDPGREGGQQELKVDSFKHDESVSGRRQVMRLQVVPIEGHYGN